MRWVAWFVCVGLLCVAWGCNRGECQYDADCPGQNICRQGECTNNLIGELCKSSGDCLAGQECVNQKCVRPECQDGSKEPCYNGPPGTAGKGLCQSGVRTCLNKKWGPCIGQIMPSSEVCDKLDNDCNTLVDDDPSCAATCQEGTTRLCFTGPAAVRGKGICRAGTETCTNKKWGPCLGQTLPLAKEVCGDNLDNNCNDKVDEGCGPCTGNQKRPCYTGPSNTRNVGICKDGQQTCQSGQWGPCVGEQKPSAEVCNTKDDDCNSKIDDSPNCSAACKAGETRECYTGPAGTKNVGTCKAGQQTCQNNTWSACQGAVTPVGEKCGDKLDNNCNNQTDEGCGVCTNGTQEVCYSGQQGCSKNPDGSYLCNSPCHSGVRTCQNGQWTNCTGEKIPLPKETCNNKIDDDCNGKIDDGCGVCTNGQTQACYTGPNGTRNVGICKPGTRTCTGNNWGPCIGEVKPGSEVCNNNRDDNCNGQSDENCSTKLHKPCKSTAECDSGQICLIAGSQGICFQDCTASAAVCQSNTDGRNVCELVAQSPQGQSLSICVKQVASGAACNALQSVFCQTHFSCIGGSCKRIVSVGAGGVCDSNSTPPKICQVGTTCTQFGAGRSSICLKNCTRQQAGSCPSTFVCVPLQSGGGVCLQTCTSNANCTYTNHECVSNNVHTSNICAPRS